MSEGRLEVSTNDCDCDVLDYGSSTYEIKFCSKHKLADKMHVLLKAVLTEGHVHPYGDFWVIPMSIRNQIRRVLNE
jgi:hypothetical protein